MEVQRTAGEMCDFQSSGLCHLCPQAPEDMAQAPRDGVFLLVTMQGLRGGGGFFHR